MIIQRRFRPLGRILQRFSRGRINKYTGVTNLAMRSEVAPAWEQDAQEPLVWPVPGGGGAPAVPTPFEDEPEAAPADPTGARRTPRDLAMILELHEPMAGEQPPSPFASAGPSVTGPPLSMGSEPTTLQRQAEAAPVPLARPVRATPPPVEGGRRRGRVIEEITPTAPDEMSADVPEAAETDTPDWETQLEAESDQPDLYNALVSEGIVQRRPEPDLSSAEVYTPPRTSSRTPPAPRPEQPTASSAGPAQPISRSTPPARPPAASESAPAQPISRSTPLASPPTAPVQRQAAPSAPDAGPSAEIRRSAAEADSLIPAEGSLEAAMLSELGLPPDTPVAGLRPSASRASTPDGPPAAPLPGPPPPPARPS
ncbi:MAG: hypothetical protein K8J31_18755, partial [Anaerolineae bacterium]|nr:hypothetical protein [Anaerolineae bacterium]